ncbi:MAG: right-handed parallel beta-helix repeat-containing protein [Rhodoferax sp.]|nr:right-handed parallel beta-helix repeat-containing protein [Rhodoferax sp.]
MDIKTKRMIAVAVSATVLTMGISACGGGGSELGAADVTAPPSTPSIDLANASDPVTVASVDDNIVVTIPPQAVTTPPVDTVPPQVTTTPSLSTGIEGASSGVATNPAADANTSLPQIVNLTHVSHAYTGVDGEIRFWLNNLPEQIAFQQAKLEICSQALCLPASSLTTKPSGPRGLIVGGIPTKTPYDIVLTLPSESGKTVYVSPTLSALLMPNPKVPASVNVGLRNNDGTIYTANNLSARTKKINVVEEAARLGLPIDLKDNPEVDDSVVINAVIKAAVAGQTIYLPTGVYNLACKTTQAYSNILVTGKSISIVGDGPSSTILKSACDDRDGNQYRGITVWGASDIDLSGFTITSNWNRARPTSTGLNNPDAGGLSFGILVNARNGVPSHTVVINNITVENFHKTGIALAAGSHSVTVSDSIVKNATDIGPGGTGYGIQLLGDGHQDAASNPYMGIPGKDSYFHKVVGNTIVGPYIRHAVLLQYWTHNNLIDGNYLANSALDVIDLHGEDEYSNEISNNAIRGGGEAGVGLGNNGDSHDRAGPDNWVHNNDIGGLAVGAQVRYGTTNATIESNAFHDFKFTPNWLSLTGVRVGKATNTRVINNVFVDKGLANYQWLRTVKDLASGNVPAGGDDLTTVTRGNECGAVASTNATSSSSYVLCK